MSSVEQPKKARAAWWWIDRWRKSTAYNDMTLEEQGAYRNLLDELWLRGGILPNDERILAKVCGDVTAWPRVREVVLARFNVTHQGLRHETHDEVVAGHAVFKERQREKGRERAKDAPRAGGRFVSPAGERSTGPVHPQPVEKSGPASSTQDTPPAGPAGHQPEHQPGDQPATSLPSPSPYSVSVTPSPAPEPSPAPRASERARPHGPDLAAQPAAPGGCPTPGPARSLARARGLTWDPNDSDHVELVGLVCRISDGEGKGGRSPRRVLADVSRIEASGKAISNGVLLGVSREWLVATIGVCRDHDLDDVEDGRSIDDDNDDEEADKS